MTVRKGGLEILLRLAASNRRLGQRIRNVPEGASHTLLHGAMGLKGIDKLLVPVVLSAKCLVRTFFLLSGVEFSLSRLQQLIWYLPHLLCLRASSSRDLGRRASLPATGQHSDVMSGRA